MVKFVSKTVFVLKVKQFEVSVRKANTKLLENISIQNGTLGYSILIEENLHFVEIQALNWQII
jgi:hypothetical protein